MKTRTLLEAGRLHRAAPGNAKPYIHAILGILLILAADHYWWAAPLSYHGEQAEAVQVLPQNGDKNKIKKPDTEAPRLPGRDSRKPVRHKARLSRNTDWGKLRKVRPKSFRQTWSQLHWPKQLHWRLNSFLEAEVLITGDGARAKGRRGAAGSGPDKAEEYQHAN